jgi:hypothetical protein
LEAISRQNKRKKVKKERNDELYFPPPISLSEEGLTIEAILLSSLPSPGPKARLPRTRSHIPYFAASAPSPKAKIGRGFI